VAPLRALLVDYGGVLTTSVTASFAAFCLATGVNPERWKALVAPAYGGPRGTAGETVDPGWWVPAVETGRMSVAEFNARVAAVLSEGLSAPLNLLAAERLRLDPEACVFVDDLPPNVEGARAVGMRGVLHRDAAITIPKLEQLLDVDLG